MHMDAGRKTVLTIWPIKGFFLSYSETSFATHKKIIGFANSLGWKLNKS